MKLKKLLSLFLAAALVVPAISVMPKEAKAENPIVQTYFTADPSPMAVGDTLYLITSHDEDVLEENKPTDDYKFFTMKNWKCYSTKDMVNWTDHGSIFGQDSFTWGHTWCYRAWAAQCVERNGKFYLYVPILRKANYNEPDMVKCDASTPNAMEVVEDDAENININKMIRKSGVERIIPDIEVGEYVSLSSSPGYGIGVAVSDTPYGPYKDAIGEPLVAGDWYDIDPTVYIDDDGQAYLFYGQTLKYCLLEDDMISLKTQPKTFNMPNYTEGPWFTKHDGTYYFMWAGRGQNSDDHKGGETLQYAYCDTALGSYTYGGLLQETLKGVTNEDGTISGSFTNHPGICDFQGHSYLFYHTTELPGGCGDGSGAHRSVCVAEFEYKDDKTIDVIGMPDSVDPIDTLNPYDRVEAETICWAEGLKTGWDNGTPICNGEDVYVYNMHDQDYITVRNVDFGSEGAKAFKASVRDAKADAAAKIEIYVDNSDTPAATLDVKEESDKWQEIYVDFDNAITGIHDIKFVFSGNYDKPENETGLSRDKNAYIHEEDTGMFKFDWWQFGKQSMKPAQEPSVTQAPPVNQAPGASQTVPTVTNTANNTTSDNAAVNADASKPADKVTVGAVKGLSAKRGKNKASLSWKKAKGATKYEVYYSTNKNFKKSAKKIVVKTNVIIKKLKHGKTYYFKVRGMAAGDGGTVYGSFSSKKKVRI